VSQEIRPQLLIATSNAGKVREFRALLPELPFTVIGLDDLPRVPPPVAETGQTFSENAVLKAEYYHAKTGLLALADDSGLEVDALGGAPGIYSARFAGEAASDADRIQKLLQALRDTPDAARTARFVCSLALTGEISSRRIREVFNGYAAGRITREPRGDGGFGYDPIFEEIDSGRTFAELSREEKSTHSHRGRALALARGFLESISVRH